MGYSPWGSTESDTTGRVTLSPSLPFSKSQRPRAELSLPSPHPAPRFRFFYEDGLKS